MFVEYSNIEWDQWVQILSNYEFQINNEAQISKSSPNNREGLFLSLVLR
jgi:hypothetical protein